MAETYKRFAGVDWPASMTDDNIRLTIAKKWREYRDRGIFEFRDPWVHLLDAAKHLFTDEYLKVSEWTEQHFHDWVMEPMLMTIGCASSGKMLLLDEPLMFPDHVGTMREARVGSLVMAASGHPVRVTGVYDHIDKPLFAVRFCDGTETVCGGEHLWTVRFWGRIEHGSRKRGARDRYGWVNKVVSTDRIASWKPSQVRHRRLQVPLTRPVDFNETPVPVEPYVLGCLLGDGSITQTLLLSSRKDDHELREEFQRGLDAQHPGYVLKRVGGSASYMVVKATADKRANAIISALKGLGVYGKDSFGKFVPDVYLHNSRRVRERVLAGLLDTDGFVDKGGHVSFTTVSERLAASVRELFESLGAWVTVRGRIPTFTAGGSRRTGHKAYTVYAHGLPAEEARRLFVLSRKRDRARSASRGVGWKAVTAVRPVADRTAYPRETRCITLAERDECGNPVEGMFPVGHYTVTHNSNDTGALIVLDWLNDPYDTIVLVGSTTRDALKIRTWESIERYFKVLKNLDVFVPGKIVPTSCLIVNDRELSDDPNAQGGKAGIHGVALNDGGKLQGAHLPYVRMVIDELATITNQEDIKTTIENLQIAKDFRFVGLMNPETWSNPSCQYIIPTGGVASVDVDTGSWRSTFGCFVRHHDGLKSPCVLHPELAEKFPFLTQRRHIEAALKRSGNNPDTPRFWKMVRGFPMPASSEGNVILDEAVAIKNHASDPADPFDPTTWIATCDGIDPAWTEDGDGAAHARCYIRRDPWGRPYLDFTNGVRSLTLNASEFPRHPAVEQMRNQVVARSREPYAAPFRQMAVDSSGNQGLASDLIIYAAAVDIMQVNFSTRASEAPLNAIEAGAATPQKTKDRIYDRGTEAWCVLAEFVRAGQVRGLPQTVIAALTQRRYAANMVKDASGMKHPAGVRHPLRLEDKEEFKKRYGRSPDECDACAMAALAAKERCGFVPFAYVVNLPRPELQNQEAQVVVTSVTSAPKPSDDFETRFDDADDLFEPEV